MNLPSPAKLAFKISLKSTIDKVTSYDVSSITDNKLSRAIAEAIVARPRPNDLDFLLVSPHCIFSSYI